MYNKYESRGVVFLGMTMQDGRELADVKNFLKANDIRWPNVYGAETSMGAYKVTAIPAVWVIGKDGKVVWNRASKTKMEDAIDEALAAPDPPAGKNTKSE